MAKWKNLHSGLSRSSFPNDYSVGVSTLTGRGVLIPARVFWDVGLYDDLNFDQCGDTELPIRASKNGYDLIVDYSSVVYSYHEDPGNINHKQSYKLREVKDYYWNIRSNTNLKYRFWFSKSAFRHSILGFIRYLTLDFIRITIHLFRQLSF